MGNGEKRVMGYGEWSVVNDGWRIATKHPFEPLPEAPVPNHPHSNLYRNPPRPRLSRYTPNPSPASYSSHSPHRTNATHGTDRIPPSPIPHPPFPAFHHPPSTIRSFFPPFPNTHSPPSRPPSPVTRPRARSAPPPFPNTRPLPRRGPTSNSRRWSAAEPTVSTALTPRPGGAPHLRLPHSPFPNTHSPLIPLFRGVR
jgi:hypothetical protein